MCVSGGFSPAHGEAAGGHRRRLKEIRGRGSAIVIQVAQIKQSNSRRAPQKVLTERQSQAAQKEMGGTWPFEDSGRRLEHIRNGEAQRGRAVGVWVRCGTTDRERKIHLECKRRLEALWRGSCPGNTPGGHDREQIERTRGLSIKMCS